ncbi:MAG: cardiolipin synthase B [Pseudomonadaceae bacterium]|nr:cardiolipin synthase B [Pseudomonadaceae bacterium]HCP55033.1 cardiolipin synthase B [Pseudomonas sp.]
MPGTVFGWRSANRFNLLNDGPQFFPRMIAAIDAAQQQVELELYLIQSGRCVELLVASLCAAAQRGVQVRCLFDDYGAQALHANERKRLSDCGVQIRCYNPLRWRHGIRNFYRDHRKLLLVDANVAFTGGTGATDEFWVPDDAQSPWHEVMVEISGPLVADWQSLFEHQWRASVAKLSWMLRPSKRIKQPPIPPDSGDGHGRVAYADARQHRDILQALVRAVSNAEQRVWLATPYFLPTWKVRRALRKAASRGIDVRLLLSGRNTDHPSVRYAGQRYYPRLLRSGIKIFEYQPRFLHLKMVLVDQWVSLGSCNFDHWNMRFNLDANLEALDSRLTQQVEQCFIDDFSQSLQVTHELWQQRPWWSRLQQRLWGWLDRVVVNLLDRRR